MTYKINGTDLTLEPTSGRWLPRRSIGVTGNAHRVYANTRSFLITWELVYPSQADQIQTFFDGIQGTGTVVASLPQYANSTYQFFDYSGVVLGEPEFGPYFEQHITAVTLLIANIRT